MVSVQNHYVSNT